MQQPNGRSVRRLPASAVVPPSTAPQVGVDRAPGLQLDSTANPAVLAFDGVLQRSDLRRVDQALRALLDQTTGPVVCDLRALEYMTPGAVRLFVALARPTSAGTARITLRAPSGQVRRLLRGLGVDRVVPVTAHD